MADLIPIPMEIPWDPWDPTLPHSHAHFYIVVITMIIVIVSGIHGGSAEHLVTGMIFFSYVRVVYFCMSFFIFVFIYSAIRLYLQGRMTAKSCSCSCSRYSEDRKKCARLVREKRINGERIDELREKVKDMLEKKFGRQVSVAKLESLIINPRVVELRQDQQDFAIACAQELGDWTVRCFFSPVLGVFIISQLPKLCVKIRILMPRIFSFYRAAWNATRS